MDKKKASDGVPLSLNRAFDFIRHVPKRLQSYMKSLENKGKDSTQRPVLLTDNRDSSAWEVNLRKQLQRWKENPEWVDPPPQVKVSVPKGSLCNLSVEFQVGLPPDAIYNIVIDPDNRRVFKNIKEVISRDVLVDDGLRQVVEVEQAALWRFLWWSGIFSVHVVVDQNRRNHTVKFKQGKSGFMKRFEGYWTLQPLFIDEEPCLPHKPKTLAEYESCTRGKGRVGSIVRLEQFVQPSVVPPPPISWYVRGITARTTEMLINDLQSEASRLRNSMVSSNSNKDLLEDDANANEINGNTVYRYDDVKRRWHSRRKRTRPSWALLS